MEGTGRKPTRDRAAYRAANKDRIKAYRVAWYAANKAKANAISRAYYLANRDRRIAAATTSYLAADPRRLMLSGARHRAKKRGVPCTITVDDIFIPDKCPVLGLALVSERGASGAPTHNSPSLDCHKPKDGYIPGGVTVISHRANSIKTNATVEELEAVLAYTKRVS